MSRVISTLRPLALPTYTPRAVRGKTKMPAITGDRAAGADFRTVLKNQSPPIVASARDTLGTVTPSLPAANTAPASSRPLMISPAAISQLTISPAAISQLTISPAAISPLMISPAAIGGGQLFVSDPIGTGPARDAVGQAVNTHYNPTLFATDSQAAALAAQLGGVVYKAPLREAGGGSPGSPFTMPEANYIKMPNGAIANAGNMVQWASIGRFDLIRNEIATPAVTTGTGADDWYKQFPGPKMPPIGSFSTPLVSP